MKSLKEYILEGILDIDNNINIDASEMTKDVIKDFLKDNYDIKGSYTIKETKNGFVVDIKGNVEVKNESISSFTDELFEFGSVSGDFGCLYCKNLISLKGAPEKVGRDFYCSGCSALTSLEGSPKEVGKDFYCGSCKSLKTLKGAPKEVRGFFSCRDCGAKFTEEDVRKYTKVTKNIYV